MNEDDKATLVYKYYAMESQSTTSPQRHYISQMLRMLNPETISRDMARIYLEFKMGTC